MNQDTAAAMACLICAAPLNRYTDTTTGQTHYAHPLGAAVHPAGHQPEPVPAHDVDTRYVCDFCSDPRIVYTLRTAPITVLASGLTGQLMQNYGTGWAACLPCATLAAAHDLDGLQARLREVSPPPDDTAAHATQLMHQTVLDSLLPGRELAALGRWPATPLAAAILPKVRDRLTALYSGPLRLPLGLDMARDQVASSLQATRLFWIDPQFTDLASHAAKSLPTTPITAADLPAPHGLLAWASPVGPHNNLVAASWTSTPDGLRIIGYASIGTSLPSIDLQHLREQVGWLTPRAHTLLDSGDPADAGSPAGVLVATWLLIAQRLAETTPTTVDKTIRAAYQRAGRPAPQVHLVRIRPTPSTDTANRRRDADGNGPQHEYRWWVRGFWRRQPYGPGRSQRRLIYVDPHLAGPTDKPIKASTTVRILAAPTPRASNDASHSQRVGLATAPRSRCGTGDQPGPATPATAGQAADRPAAPQRDGSLLFVRAAVIRGSPARPVVPACLRVERQLAATQPQRRDVLHRPAETRRHEVAHPAKTLPAPGATRYQLVTTRTATWRVRHVPLAEEPVCIVPHSVVGPRREHHLPQPGHPTHVEHLNSVAGRRVHA